MPHRRLEIGNALGQRNPFLAKVVSPSVRTHASHFGYQVFARNSILVYHLAFQSGSILGVTVQSDSYKMSDALGRVSVKVIAELPRALIYLMILQGSEIPTPLEARR